ncbi:CD99 antigen isoform X3 [Peromyscus californicus insignis]|uniref:CD99 antigen isoform X3 n=1 Tax=Peromyscus californicus insignis TaxID=564181 RepID=UPI0022A691E4|nr:CD99 antigen isoform X3 [Peromyscus californicus insignis]
MRSRTPRSRVPTRKPAGGGAGDDLDLSDALGGHDPPPPAPRPPRPRDPQKPDSRPAGGDFSNSDLEDAAGGRGGVGGRGEGPRSDAPDPAGTGRAPSPQHPRR